MVSEVYFELPWPPSVNAMYVNAPNLNAHEIFEKNRHYPTTHPTQAPDGSKKKNRGRFLTSDARAYKRNATLLIHYSCLAVKYGKEKIEVKIVQFPPDRRKRDRDNGIKIVFDCIEKSGLIDNDNQIVAFEVVDGHPSLSPHWKIWIRPYQRNKPFPAFQKFIDTLPEGKD